MRINELLVESQQLDEGPFTQAVGKVGGKIAKGIANVGKDLKTGFKAGYGGEQPAADPAIAAPAKQTPATTKPSLAPAAAPAKSSGVIDQFKQGFARGQGEPAAASNVAVPSVDPAAEKQSKIGVGQINKIIPTLRTRDLMSLQANLEKAIASKKKAPAIQPAEQPVAAPAATPTPAASSAEPIVKGKKKSAPKVAKPTQAEIDADRARLLGPNSESAVKQGRVVAESFSLYRKH